MKLKSFNFKVINSTNDLAIRIIKNTNNKSGIVIAEKQKNGRGQYSRKWKSFKGNLFLSIFFSIDKMKISGILQEILTKSDEKFIIIGVGINLIKSPTIKDYLTTILSL